MEVKTFKFWFLQEMYELFVNTLTNSTILKNRIGLVLLIKYLMQAVYNIFSITIIY